MKEPLTDRQQQVLDFVQASAAERGRPPTVREIAAHFGFASPKAASDHLAALERKGWIKKERFVARGLASNDPPPGIPVLGRVAAGAPIDAIEHVEDHLPIGDVFGPGRFFAVKVEGESMRDDGIRTGDHVVVKLDTEVRQGQIAVAYVDGQATVKRFFRTGEGVRLDPANPDFQPLFVTADTGEFRLAGPVVGVLRILR